MEEWRDAPGFPGYMVSSLGGIKSRFGRILKQFPGRGGYLRVSTYRREGGKMKVCVIHRAVCEAFHGPPNGRHAAHFNGDKLDNRASNLVWATPKENAAHKIMHGRQRRGEQVALSRLTSKDVLRIRAEARAGATASALAREYGYSSCGMRSVIKRITWRHI